MARTPALLFSRKRTGLSRMRMNHNCRIRPLLLKLEDRTVPATINWTGGVDGNGTNWTDPANWNPAQVPGTSDDAVLGTTGAKPGINVASASVHSVTSSRNLFLANTGTFSIGSAVSDFSSDSTGGGLIIGNGGFFADNGATIRGNVVSDSPFSNSGLLTLDWCNLAVASTVTNSGTLQFESYGKLRANGGLINSGTVVVGTGEDIYVDFQTTPITTTAGSIIRIMGSSINTALNTYGFINNGLIELAYTQGNNHAILGILNGQLTNAASGVLSGNGWLRGSLSSSGTVSPGLNGPGLLRIDGIAALDGQLVTDLNGTAVGTEFDQLAVNGKVTLSGSLSVNVGYAAKAGDSFVIVNNDGTDAISGTFAGLPQLGTFTIGSTQFQINYNGGTGNDVVITIIRPPLSTVINDGAPQRSRVNSVKVTFDSVVTLPTNPVTAFELRRQSDNALVALTADVVNTTRTTVTLTFNGALSEFGSLADGRYTLTAFASQINGGVFDGNGDGVAGDDYVLASGGTTGVFRLFGDANGNARVDSNDFAAFRMAFGSGGSIFDFDGDNQTNSNDFAEFRKRFGLMI